MLILAIVLFGGLLTKVIALSFKVAWGLLKVLAILLCIAALPLIVIFAIGAGGFLLLIPIFLVSAAWGCLSAAS